MNLRDSLSLEKKNNNNEKMTYIVPLGTEANPNHSVMVELWTPLPHPSPSLKLNLRAIKSTPMHLLPKESGLITKMDANDFPLFTANQVLLLPTLTWVDREFGVKAGISNLRPREMGGVGWAAMRRQPACHLNQKHYLEKLQQCGTCNRLPERHNLHLGSGYETWL